LIDPIPRIGELAEKYGLWCHVDACVGGFLLPFYKAIGQDLRDWNFDVPGVRSISADLHKFGFTPHGMSSVTFRDEALREHLVFDFDDWPSGRYATESIQGTRPARAAAAAWATMRHLGRDGYLDGQYRYVRGQPRRRPSRLSPRPDPGTGIASLHHESGGGRPAHRYAARSA
jgi:glutamate/tyrosine decarboxylase-like PLP-dependent enzyme